MKSHTVYMKFVLISLLGHLILLIIIALWPTDSTRSHKTNLWQAGSENHFSITLSTSQPYNSMQTEENTISQKPLRPTAKNQNNIKTQNQVSTNDFSNGNGPNSSGEGLDATGNSTASLQARIRKKIMQSRLLPQNDEGEILSGKVTLKFLITPDGRVENLHIIKSSQNSFIDQAALKSIKRAEPLPYLKNPIAIEIDYQ